MPENLELGNIAAPYTFISLFKHQIYRDIIAFALINGNIENVTPRTWTAEFEAVLEMCGGALVVITRYETSDDIIQMLDTYTTWCASQIDENIKLTPTKVEWIQLARDETNIVEMFKYATLLTGAMLIISGEFPDLHVVTSVSFGLETDIVNRRTTGLVIATLRAILNVTFNILPEIENEMNENLEENMRTVLLRVSYLEWYQGSRDRLLLDLCHIVAEVRIALRNFKESVQFYGSNAIPRRFIEDVETEMENTEKNINLVQSKLEHLAGILMDNRRRFFAFLDSLTMSFYGTVFAITSAGIWFNLDNTSKLRLNLLIATVIIGVLALVTRICSSQMCEFWRIRISYF